MHTATILCFALFCSNGVGSPNPDLREGLNIGCAVDLYEHGLQTATLALRDGADEETVVVAPRLGEVDRRSVGPSVRPGGRACFFRVWQLATQREGGGLNQSLVNTKQKGGVPGDSRTGRVGPMNPSKTRISADQNPKTYTPGFPKYWSAASSKSGHQSWPDMATRS